MFNLTGDGGGLPPLEAGSHQYSSRRDRRPNFITSASTDEEEEGIRTTSRSVKGAISMRLLTTRDYKSLTKHAKNHDSFSDVVEGI